MEGQPIRGRRPAERLSPEGRVDSDRRGGAAGAAHCNVAIKKELVHGCAFETGSEAYGAVSDYIENYNAKRRHSAAGNQSPTNFELANSGRLAA